MKSHKENETPPVESETGPNPIASVIWLHGLGADGHDFEPVIEQLALPAELPLRFVFPHAPFRPVTVNNGQVMRAWYDMVFSGQQLSADPEHITEAELIVHGLIEREIGRGISLGNIMLAGFSQGGAVVLHTALRYHTRLAGVLALSTYVPFPDQLADKPISLPVFMAHGIDDPLIPLALAEATHQLLLAKGLPVQWQTYPMPHAVCAAEISDISSWLQKIFLE